MILIPQTSFWTTFTSENEGSDCEYLGGMAVCALVSESPTSEEVANSNPLWLVYGWNGSEYNYAIVRNIGVDIYQTCYDCDRVRDAKDAQTAVDAANEYQGGEADWIGDIASGEMTTLSGVLEHGVIPHVALDGHKAAQNFLRARIGALKWES